VASEDEASASLRRRTRGASRSSSNDAGSMMGRNGATSSMILQPQSGSLGVGVEATSSGTRRQSGLAGAKCF